jgi:hypothetical protein
MIYPVVSVSISFDLVCAGFCCVGRLAAHARKDDAAPCMLARCVAHVRSQTAGLACCMLVGLACIRRFSYNFVSFVFVTIPGFYPVDPGLIPFCLLLKCFSLF